MHNSSCVIESSGYGCNCTAGFSGVICETGTISLDYFLLLQPFPYLGTAHQVSSLHVLQSCTSSVFTCLSFRYFLITSLHLSFSLPIFRCPTTSIFHVLITLHSFSPHVLTISVSLLLFFSLMFATPSLALFSLFLIVFKSVLNTVICKNNQDDF